jgi:hypothetical protein
LWEALQHNKNQELKIADNSDIEAILNQVNDSDVCVKFALYCAKDVQKIANDAGVNECISLVEQWLKNKKLVSTEQLRAASRAASNAASNAAYHAANVANAARAARAACYVADAADYAAYNATVAADAAASAARSHAWVNGQYDETIDAAKMAEYRSKLINYINMGKAVSSVNSKNSASFHDELNYLLNVNIEPNDENYEHYIFDILAALEEGDKDIVSFMQKYHIGANDYGALARLVKTDYLANRNFFELLEKIRKK